LILFNSFILDQVSKTIIFEAKVAAFNTSYKDNNSEQGKEMCKIICKIFAHACKCIYIVLNRSAKFLVYKIHKQWSNEIDIVLSQESHIIYSKLYYFFKTRTEFKIFAQSRVLLCSQIDPLNEKNSFTGCTSSSSFETVLHNNRLAALDLRAGVEQPFDCLIARNRLAVQSTRRSMDWTFEDNMVDGLFFCATQAAGRHLTSLRP